MPETASRPSYIWTREQAIAKGEKGRATLRARAAKRQQLIALANSVRRSPPQEALEIILADTYRTYARTPKDSVAAERLARTLLTLEHIRRIQGKAPRPGSVGSPSSSAVAQSGPIGEAPPINPVPQPQPLLPDPAPTDLDAPPEMSPEL
jgi:hypothetical protein